jgi:hypothetical protein
VLDLAVKGDGRGLLFGFVFTHGSDYTLATEIVMEYYYCQLDTVFALQYGYTLQCKIGD